MRIKLISPRMTLRPMDSEFKRLMAPSLALATLAALTPPEHEVELADENIEPLTPDDCPDLVGITVNVDTSGRAYAMADAYRARGIPVVLGGIHASACPEEAGVHADAVCIGDAEPVWGRLLADLTAGNLQARYAASAPLRASRIPLPRWDVVDTRKYLYTNIVCASRGCPFRCDFCYNSCAYRHERYRPRPVPEVIREIRQLGTRHVMFVDDNFIGDPGWTRNLVRAMTPLGLKWNAAVSVNIDRHPDLLSEMAASGCQSLFIGFESINPAALSGAGKRQNRVSRYESLIEMVHGHGMMINSSLVFGFDEDGPDVFPATLDWLVRHRIETMTAHILTPYPGTALHERMVRNGRIIDQDPTHYNTAHVVFRPRQLAAAELKQGYLWMYDQFYSLRNIWRRLPKCRSQRLPYLLFNLGYRKLGRLASAVGRRGSMAALGRLGRRLAYGLE